MRIIEKCWVDLNEGYQTVVALEARLKLDWKRAMQVAQKRSEQAAITRHRQTRKIAGIAFLLLLFICVMFWVGSFYLPDYKGQLLLYFCLLTIPGVISGAVYLFSLGNFRMKIQPQLSLDLIEPWWRSLRPKRYVIRTTGGRAEVDFLKSLSFLDNNHIAIWGLLTSAKMTSDTDVLLLGPTGIWIFEVKYWSGEISKRDGVWYADHKFRGRKFYDQGPDEQWKAQKAEIVKTMQMRLRSKPWLAELIKGGVVFAHQEAVFGQIAGHMAPYGRPESWRKRIRATKPVPDFKIEDQLQLLDALIHYANRYEREELKIVSAREEADQLYATAVAALRKYVSEQVK